LLLLLLLFRLLSCLTGPILCEWAAAEAGRCCCSWTARGRNDCPNLNRRHCRCWPAIDGPFDVVAAAAAAATDEWACRADW
jgi:hypothetical protein